MSERQAFNEAWRQRQRADAMDSIVGAAQEVVDAFDFGNHESYLMWKIDKLREAIREWAMTDKGLI